MKSGLRLLTQAVDLAHRIGDKNTLWITAVALFYYDQAPQRIEQRVRLAEELWAGPHAGESYIGTATLWWIYSYFLVVGQRQRAEEVMEELRVIATRTKQYLFELSLMGMDSFLVVMDGRLEEALNMITRMRISAEETGLAASFPTQIMTSFRIVFYLGKYLETIESRIRTAEGGPVLCLLLAHLGRKEESAEILEKHVVRRPHIGTLEDETPTSVDILYLEAASLVGHRKAAELLLNRFVGITTCTTGMYYITCIPRHQGGAAALLGRYDEARKYYDEAIKVCTEMRFRPELALTRLQLAQLLMEHFPYEKKDAIEHLDLAIKDFREMKMNTYLERALKHQEILKA